MERRSVARAGLRWTCRAAGPAGAPPGRRCRCTGATGRPWPARGRNGGVARGRGRRVRGRRGAGPGGFGCGPRSGVRGPKGKN
jgi:hypothetical protein